MSKEIYKEIQYAKWVCCQVLFALVVIISAIIYVAIVSNPIDLNFIVVSFLFLLFAVPVALYEHVMEIYIDDTYIIIKQMLGLIKRKIKIKDVISYEIKSYESHRDIYEYRKNKVSVYIVYDHKYTIKIEMKGKAVELKTKKGDYLIGTQNPERIIEILKTQIGDKKELQNP